MLQFINFLLASLPYLACFALSARRGSNPKVKKVTDRESPPFRAKQAFLSINGAQHREIGSGKSIKRLDSRVRDKSSLSGRIRHFSRVSEHNFCRDREVGRRGGGPTVKRVMAGLLALNQASLSREGRRERAQNVNFNGS